MNNTCRLCEDEERMTAYDEKCKRLCEEERKMEASDCLCKNGKCKKTCKLCGQNCQVQLLFLSQWGVAPLKSVLGVQKMIVRMKECASGRMKIVLIKLNIHHQLKFLHILQVKDLFPLGRIKMIIMDNLTERKVQKIVELPSQSFLHLLYPLSHPSKKNPNVFLRKNSVKFYSNFKNSDIF